VIVPWLVAASLFEDAYEYSSSAEAVLNAWMTYYVELDSKKVIDATLHQRYWMKMYVASRRAMSNSTPSPGLFVEWALREAAFGDWFLTRLNKRIECNADSAYRVIKNLQKLRVLDSPQPRVGPPSLTQDWVKFLLDDAIQRELEQESFTPRCIVALVAWDQLFLDSSTKPQYKVFSQSRPCENDTPLCEHTQESLWLSVEETEHSNSSVEWYNECFE